MVILENEYCRMALNDDGTWDSLTAKKTGQEGIRRKGQGLWKLVMHYGGSFEAAVHASDGQAPRIERISDTEAVLRYDAITYAGKSLEIGLELRLMLEGDEIKGYARLTNRSPATVAELWFPLIDGITTLGEREDEEALVIPQNHGRIIRRPFAYFGSRKEHTWYTPEAHRMVLMYPGLAAMPWLDLANRDGGLYLACYNPYLTTQATLAGKEWEPDRLRLGIIHFPYAAAGEDWTSPVTVIGLHQGDWHEAARRYRAWYDTAMGLERQPLSPRPKWVWDMTGWQLVIMRAQSGAVDWRYDELPELFAAASAAGIDTLMLFGWNDEGFDHLYPIYHPSPALGGEEALRRAIRDIQAQGGRVILYTQGRLIDPTTDFYREEGREIAVKNVWGSEYREIYRFWNEGAALAHSSGINFAVACPSHPRWKEVLLSQAELVKSLGADGVLFDQIGGTCVPYLCFDRSHPHPSPSSNFAPAMRDNHRYVRSRVQADDPEFAVVTENLSDALCTQYDAVHGQGVGGRIGPESLPQVFRYTFPEAITTNRIIGWEETEIASYAFVHGLRFDVEIGGARGYLRDAPLLTRHLANLSEIRRTYKEVLLRGRYVDRDGVRCDNEAVVLGAHIREPRAADSQAVDPEQTGAAPLVQPGTFREKTETGRVGVHGWYAPVGGADPGGIWGVVLAWNPTNAAQTLKELTWFGRAWSRVVCVLPPEPDGDERGPQVFSAGKEDPVLAPGEVRAYVFEGFAKERAKDAPGRRRQDA